jgi:hypothetical protein
MLYTLFITIQEMLTRQAKRNLDSTPKSLFNQDIETGIYTVQIDFDEASLAWKANKKSKGNGTYQYVCEQQLSIHRTCKNTAILGSPYCSMHQYHSDKHKIADMV